MDDDSEHKVDDLNNGWVLNSEWIGKKERELCQSDGNSALSKCEPFFQDFPAPPQLCSFQPQYYLG